MSEDVISDALHPELGALWRHRALVAVALYAFVALVGALYYALLLGEFGLNAFDYWEATDFVLATFREPLSMVFGLIAISFYLSLTQPARVNDWFFGRYPGLGRVLKYQTWRDWRMFNPQFGPLLGLLLALLWFVIVMGSFADRAANQARHGTGDDVRYALAGRPLAPAQLLATTNRFVFLVLPAAEPRDARLLAIPVDQLEMLEHCGARRGGWRALARGAEHCDGAPAVVAPLPAPAAAPTTAPSRTP